MTDQRKLPVKQSLLLCVSASPRFSSPRQDFFPKFYGVSGTFDYDGGTAFQGLLMRRAWYAIRDTLSGVAGISPLTFAQLLRKPRNLPIFQSDVLRAYRSNSGRRAPSAFPHELVPPNGPINMRVGENRIYPIDESHFVLIELVAAIHPK